MGRVISMVKSKEDVQKFIDHGSADTKVAAEKRFVKEVKEAEASMAQGNYVTSAELHEFLGI